MPTKLKQAAETVDLSTKERNRYIRKFQESLEYEKALVLLDRTSAENQGNWFYVAQFAPTDVVKQWLAAGASTQQMNKNKQNVLHVATSLNRSADAYALLVKQASKSQLNQLGSIWSYTALLCDSGSKSRSDGVATCSRR